MAGEINGAALRCGPPRQPNAKFLLSVLGEAADMLGFAWPGIEQMMLLTSMSKSTVIRHLEELERDGWILVFRKAINHKANVYRVNLEKLGVPMPPLEKKVRCNLREIGVMVTPEVRELMDLLDAKRAMPHIEPKRQRKPPRAHRSSAKTENSGVNLEPIDRTPVTDDPQESGVNPQGGQVSICEKSGVNLEKPPYPLKGGTVIDPSVDPSTTQNQHPYPSPAKGERKPDFAEPEAQHHTGSTPWQAFKSALRESYRAANDVPARLKRNFTQLIDGEDDWDAGFAEAQFVDQESTEGDSEEMLWIIAHPRPAVCQRFLAKYSRRVKDAMGKVFGVEWQITVRDLKEAA